MSRTGDEMDAAGSNESESIVLQETPSDSALNESHGGRRKTLNDAVLYLKEVKDTFHDQRDKYDMFLNVMTDIKAQTIDSSTVVARLKELFKGQNNLIIKFNTFAPPEYKITTLDDEEEDLSTVFNIFTNSKSII